MACQKICCGPKHLLSLAQEKCDDSAGNVKDVCEKEAKADLVEANATVQLTAVKANAQANEKVSEARTEAKEKRREAHQDAAKVKRDTNFAVARKKCNALSGDAKDVCLIEAETYYGK